ncbi:MAG: hypothetical protein WDZ41_05200 [Candidatus Babeliales bacterium]
MSYFHSLKDSAKQSMINCASGLNQWIKNHKAELGLTTLASTGLSCKYGINKTLFGATVLGGVYLYKYVQHRQFLNNAEKMLGNSIPSNFKSIDENNFLFATWQIDEWPLAKDISDNKQAVINNLVNDLKLEDKIFVKYESEARVKPENINGAHLKGHINREIKCFKNLLNKINDLTNIESVLHKVAKNQQKNGQHILIDSKYCKTLDANNFNNFENTVLTNCKFHKNASILLIKSKNPLNWVIAPHYEKAIRIYMKLYKAYIRLSSIKDIADTLDIKAIEENKNNKKLLNEFNQIVRDMNLNQSNIGINIQAKHAQIQRLGKLQSKLKNIKKDHRSEAVIIQDKLKLIGDLLNETKLNNNLIIDSLLDIETTINNILSKKLN